MGGKGVQPAHWQLPVSQTWRGEAEPSVAAPKSRSPKFDLGQRPSCPALRGQSPSIQVTRQPTTRTTAQWTGGLFEKADP